MGGGGRGKVIQERLGVEVGHLDICVPVQILRAQLGRDQYILPKIGFAGKVDPELIGRQIDPPLNFLEPKDRLLSHAEISRPFSISIVSCGASDSKSFNRGGSCSWMIAEGKGMDFSFSGDLPGSSRIMVGASALIREILTFPRSRGMIWGAMVIASAATLTFSGTNTWACWITIRGRGKNEKSTF